MPFRHSITSDLSRGLIPMKNGLWFRRALQKISYAVGVQDKATVERFTLSSKGGGKHAVGLRGPDPVSVGFAIAVHVAGV